MKTESLNCLSFPASPVSCFNPQSRDFDLSQCCSVAFVKFRLTIFPPSPIDTRVQAIRLESLHGPVTTYCYRCATLTHFSSLLWWGGLGTQHFQPEGDKLVLVELESDHWDWDGHCRDHICVTHIFFETQAPFFWRSLSPNYNCGAMVTQQRMLPS